MLELKLVNWSTASFKACAAMLNIQAMNFMTYDNPITCSTGMTSNITIKDTIMDSYIAMCQDHYVLVKNSADCTYCGMHTKNTFQAHLTDK